jgi:hypothetical protein
MQQRFNNLRSSKFSKRLNKLFLFFSFFGVHLFFLSQANAALTLQSYSSVHSFFATTNSSVVTIYAGMTDKSSTCTTSACDSCSLITTQIDATTVCNTMEIRPSADSISFVVKTDSTALGTSPAFTITTSTSGSSGSTAVTLTANPVLAQNAATTYTATWAEICNAAGATAACNKSFATTLTLGWAPTSGGTLTESVQFGIKFRYAKTSAATYTKYCKDTVAADSYAGFCYFTAYPGDSKAYIFPKMNLSNSFVVNDLQAGSMTAPLAADPSGITYSKLRVCWFEGTATGIMTPGGSKCSDLNLDLSDTAHPKTSPMYVSGLTNEVPYYFNIASMDQAGIVTNFLEQGAAPTTAPLATTLDWKTVLTPPEGAAQWATPGPVYGLLDGQGCFIATAAYGSIMAPEVNTFRKFRSEYLLKSELGKEFVRSYYKYSPPLAEFIAKYDGLRLLARIFLFPILIFVKLALWIGIVPTIFFIFGLSIFSVIHYRRKKSGGHV